MVAAKKVAKKSGTVKFTLDCSTAAQDALLDVESVEAYLNDKIKVDGRLGNFEKTDRATGVTVRRVTVSTEGGVVTVEAMLPFKKRYIKYLTKRFLCQSGIRDFLRVVAVGKHDYALKYFAAVKEGVKA